jgi:hypothetical protein
VHEKFHHLPEPIALVSTPATHRFDIAVLTRRGIGVVELKHHEGMIDIHPVTKRWMAGNDVEIHAGSGSNPANTPHEQVQGYARALRNRLIKPRPQGGDPYLPGGKRGWAKMKIDTAVCFTNPRAGIIQLKKKYNAFERQESWERFSLLTPADFATWVMTLSLQVDDRVGRGEYERLELSSNRIRTIAEKLLAAVEWEQARGLISGGRPYAYLVPESHPSMNAIPLRDEEETVGRHPDRCTKYVSSDLTKVSRVHLHVKRASDGAWVKDVSSSGTFVNGRQLARDEWEPLALGARIGLGAPTHSDGALLVQLVRSVEDLPQTLPHE